MKSAKHFAQVGIIFIEESKLSSTKITH